MSQSKEITRLLQQKDDESRDELFSIVYDDLRKIAAALFKGEFRPNHTLQATALVHESFLRLVGTGDEVSCQSRAHFFGIAARSIEKIGYERIRVKTIIGYYAGQNRHGADNDRRLQSGD